MKTFKYRWFEEAGGPAFFEAVLGPVRDSVKRGVEIGSFEGMSTCWLLENVLTKPGDELFCIDTWAGKEELTDEPWAEIQARFAKNTKEYKRRLDVRRGASRRVIYDMTPGWFDFVYVDGSHRASDVLADMVHGWDLLKKGGLLLCDDYLWHPPGWDAKRVPKAAVDAFKAVMAPEFEQVFDGYQVAFRRIVGF